jgi:hypothetical protein
VLNKGQDVAPDAKRRPTPSKERFHGYSFLARQLVRPQGPENVWAVAAAFSAAEGS